MITTSSTTTLDMTLKAGDFNNDNAVDVSDLIAVINHYNQRQGVGNNSLESCDFNGDGADDVTDLLTVINNYNRLGD